MLLPQPSCQGGRVVGGIIPVTLHLTQILTALRLRGGPNGGAVTALYYAQTCAEKKTKTPPVVMCENFARRSTGLIATVDPPGIKKTAALSKGLFPRRSSTS